MWRYSKEVQIGPEFAVQTFKDFKKSTALTVQELQPLLICWPHFRCSEVAGQIDMILITRSVFKTCMKILTSITWSFLPWDAESLDFNRILIVWFKIPTVGLQRQKKRHFNCVKIVPGVPTSRSQTHQWIDYIMFGPKSSRKNSCWLVLYQRWYWVKSSKQLLCIFM